MRELLYKLQICHYQNAEFYRLVHQPTTGQVQLTARVKRLRALVVGLCLLGLGLPCLWLAATVAFANTLLQPVEKAIQGKFLRRAKRRLRQMPNLIKIGITGSYGKTSVKNILQAMLATKYRVVASPASFNTPMGLARTVNEVLTPDTQVLIMEMGARRSGEIRELCDLLHPQHGIITSIGACHLQTFGDLATVAKTKAELFASLPPDGIAVTDGDHELCRTLTHPNLRLVHFTDQVYDTPLLGRHNQKNILLCATLAQALGISADAIRQVAANLSPTPHRLQKIVAPNGIIILDDSYNANPTSAASALAVLAEFKTRKVVQTPGFVEQGDYAATAHAQFCEQLKAVADAVIVVGEVNQAYFATGLQGFGGAVYYVATREDAKKIYPQILRSGDVLLIENDLPEQY